MGRAVLTLDLADVAGSMQIPEGYELISAHYDLNTRRLHFLVESSDLAKEDAIGQLPRLYLTASVEYQQCGHHKTTVSIQKGLY